jgi:hypothetical protein
VARRLARADSRLQLFLLDSGAIIAESKGDPALRAQIREALRQGATLIVPPIVVTQTYRNDPADVRLNRLLNAVVVPEIDATLAKVAGGLLARAGLGDACDAQVAAEALRRAPCVVLTSDPDDMHRLIGDRSDIRIVNVDQL